MNKRRRHLGCWLSGFTALVLVGGCGGPSYNPGGPEVGPSAISPPSSVGSPSSAAAAPSGTSAAPAPGVAQPLRADRPRGTAGPSAAAGSALDVLGSRLLAQLPAADNAVLSPYSIYAVLAMARAGAKGATGAQLDSVLGGDGSVQTGNVTAVDKAVFDARVAGTPPVGADPATTDTRPVSVDVANSVWLSPALPVRPSYLDALATGFGVGMYQIDYAADPEAARKSINAWVGDHTKDLIPELLGEGVITSDTVMTLVNALYLSAPWQEPFNKTAAPMSFVSGAGQVTTTPGMSVTSEFASAKGKGWTSVTVPYPGAGLAMTIVLPDTGSFAKVRTELPPVLKAAATAKPSGAVALTMPLFKAEAHLSLIPAMEALGVKDLFTPSADLSGIAGNPGDLMAGALVHQAVITVDEKGTEAAAATAMTAVPTSGFGGEIKNVTVDRPFFYSVHDVVTGAPLFLGQVTDPTK